jgi:hypothetical protein
MSADMDDSGTPDFTDQAGSETLEPVTLGIKWTRKHEKRLREAFEKGRPLQSIRLSGLELDLVAIGFMQTLDKGHSVHPYIGITDKGIAFLSQARQQRLERQDIHNSLASRLAKHLQSKSKMTWENILFTNPHKHLLESQWRQVRPDVYACEATLQAKNARPEIYEVKVSRADFLADMAKPGKGAGYSDLAEAVYFCTPQGMVSPDEVPDGIGLVWETNSGTFIIKKRAKRRKGFQLHPDTLMTLVIKRGSANQP